MQKTENSFFQFFENFEVFLEFLAVDEQDRIRNLMIGYHVTFGGIGPEVAGSHKPEVAFKVITSFQPCRQRVLAELQSFA